MTYVPDASPCYRCVFEVTPPKDVVPSCREASVMGAIAGIIGTMQALEAVKYIIGRVELFTVIILVFDELKMEWQKVKLPKKKTSVPYAAILLL